MKSRDLFNRLARQYDQSAYLSREIADQLMQRLVQQHLQPNTILDLGCATGYLSQQLRKHFPQAWIISADISENMLQLLQNKTTTQCVQMDANQLAITPKSVDVICCHLLLHYCQDSANFFNTINQALKDDGVFIFTTYGPDTLHELSLHVPFRDMHYLGDELLQAGFNNPVVDNERLTLQYTSQQKLLQDIVEQGGEHLIPADISSDDNAISVTAEVIYGYALGKTIQRQVANEVYVPVNVLTKKSR